MVFRGSKIFLQNLTQHLTKSLRTGSGWDHVRIVCRIWNFRLSEERRRRNGFKSDWRGYYRNFQTILSTGVRRKNSALLSFRLTRPPHGMITAAPAVFGKCFSIWFSLFSSNNF
ncbi:hypothetical protein CEXT_59011 [Caerostris extrusa]|uniref:Uncharacterized protein n=1 Tax=Caerostris extrusa TaxID=172846 RepID=A0AAV4P8N8_CAEEX|nr:hypothetical protein CEXT_59011 [Caerostris extrusa]